MQVLHGTVQHYAWGTTDAIPELLGVPADGRPFAEYWLGAHPLSPSQVDGNTLDSLVREHPEVVGGPSRATFGDQLPYLLKILSARHALSLQAHPPTQPIRFPMCPLLTGRIRQCPISLTRAS